MKTCRILVVDDETINLNIMTAILTAESHQVVAVPSGLDALKHCRAAEGVFDLILLDVHMPALNGFETALCLRRLDGLAAVPIIFVSARATQADQEAGLAAGGNFYLTKPFRRKDLLDAIARFLPDGQGPQRSHEEIA